MPIIDQDTITITRGSRVGRNDIKLSLRWVTSAGEDMGTFDFGFATDAELRSVIDTQTIEDVLRSVATAFINKDTGQLRTGVFDNAIGKSYQITTKLNQV